MFLPEQGPESWFPVVVLASWLSILLNEGFGAMIAAIKKWLKKVLG